MHEKTTYGRFPANELLTLQLDTGIGRCGGAALFFLEHRFLQQFEYYLVGELSLVIEC